LQADSEVHAGELVARNFARSIQYPSIKLPPT